MSNFLSRLGARQTGEPAIRPRAVSRFETASTAASRPENALSGAEESILGAQPLQPASPGRPDGNRGDAIRNTSQQSKPSAGQLRHPGQLLDDEIEQRLRDLLNGATRASFAPQQTERPSQDRTARESVGALAVAESNSASRHDSPNPTTPVITNIAPVVAVAARPDARREPSLRDAARADRDTAPREPDVVHVHIGRVEVRAVHAAPERARTRTQTGAEVARPLSLDRYLNAKKLP